MDRRNFTLAFLSAFAASQQSFALQSQQQTRLAQGDLHDPTISGPGEPGLIAHWMDGWETRGYKGPLVLRRFLDPVYALDKPIQWVPGSALHNPQYASFTVPKGFVTDLASIPRVFWSALRPDGNYAYSAVLHDYLYWTQFRPRKVADDILRRSMSDFKVPSATAWFIYKAVRVGGGQSWERNRMLRSQGERRILTQFPEDPATTWPAWQQNQSHFSGVM